MLELCEVSELCLLHLRFFVSKVEGLWLSGFVIRSPVLGTAMSPVVCSWNSDHVFVV